MAESNNANNSLTAEDFLKRLSSDSQKADEINQRLYDLVKALILKIFGKWQIKFDDDDVQGIMNHTFIIAYAKFAKGKELDFSDPPKSLQSYFWCIADNLCKAHIRRIIKDSQNDSLSNPNEDGLERQIISQNQNALEKLTEEEERKTRLICQNNAITRLNEDDRNLIKSYYNHGTKTPQEKKLERKKIAHEHEISSEGLAVKVHRLREKMRPFYQNCLREKGLTLISK